MNDMTTPPATTITVSQPSTQITEVSTLLGQAKAFQVVDDDTAQLAADELKVIVAKKAVIEEERQKITKPLFEAQRNTNALFKKLSDPLEQAEREYKTKIITYQGEVEKKRREEAAKAEEAARKERERLEAEAKKLEKKGKVEEAAAKREVATMMPTTFEAPPPAKVVGLSTRANWKARLKPGSTKRDLIVFVAATPGFDYLLDINESKCDGLAKQAEAVDVGVPCLEGYNAVVASIR